MHVFVWLREVFHRTYIFCVLLFKWSWFCNCEEFRYLFSSGHYDWDREYKIQYTHFLPASHPKWVYNTYQWFIELKRFGICAPFFVQFCAVAMCVCVIQIEYYSRWAFEYIVRFVHTVKSSNLHPFDVAGVSCVRVCAPMVRAHIKWSIFLFNSNRISYGVAFKNSYRRSQCKWIYKIPRPNEKRLRHS